MTQTSQIPDWIFILQIDRRFPFYNRVKEGLEGVWTPCCVHSWQSLNTTRRGHKEQGSGGGDGDAIKGASPSPLLIAAVRPAAIKGCHLSVAARRRHLFHHPPWWKCHRGVWRCGAGGGAEPWGEGGGRLCENFLSDDKMPGK